MTGIINALNRIAEKLGALVISLNQIDYVARAYLSSNQTITTATFTKINLDTESYDPNNNFDTTNKRWTCPVAGYYQINTSVSLADPNTLMRIQVLIYKNGNYISVGETLIPALAGCYPILAHEDCLSLVVGDYIELYFYHSSGSNKTLSSGSHGTYITIAKINA